MEKHISCDFKCKYNSATCNSNQKWNNKLYQCEYKNYRACKKDYSWNASTCICENDKYLKVFLILQRLLVMKLYLLWILCQQKSQIL